MKCIACGLPAVSITGYGLTYCSDCVMHSVMGGVYPLDSDVGQQILKEAVVRDLIGGEVVFTSSAMEYFLNKHFPTQ